MKVSFAYILWLCLALSTLSSCSQKKLARPDYEEEFKFEIAHSVCEKGGTTYRVIVENPLSYSILWELNGEALGHERQTPCICGGRVKVYVTRLEDGIRKEQTIVIPECSID
ncbi:MAG: hypothetical protein AAF599_16055 [Bacteroidota bacterium]